MSAVLHKQGVHKVKGASSMRGGEITRETNVSCNLFTSFLEDQIDYAGSFKCMEVTDQKRNFFCSTKSIQSVGHNTATNVHPLHV
jgi:hypothetical protein